MDRSPGLAAVTRTAALLLGGALLLGACGPVGRGAPGDVTRQFWTALAQGDFDAARERSTAPTPAPLRELAESHPVAEIEIGQVLRNELQALVETRLRRDGKDVPLTFNTHLARYDGEWRVDAEATRAELSRAALAFSVEELKQSLEVGAELLADTLEQSALEFSQALRSALEEVERDLQDHQSPQGP